jgi:large subunit ribosomal protein L18
MVKKNDRKAERIRRHIRVRTKVKGTAETPRLCVFRSNANLYTQIIDDDKQVTLVSACTLEKDVKNKASNKEAAKEIGALIAKRAIEKNIKDVVFDRGGYIYHGVVAEVATAAREGGLNF